MLQLCPHPARSQNPTSLVAAMHATPGVSRQVGPPWYTSQFPPQMLPIRLSQCVTIVVPRFPTWTEGSPRNVSLASVVSSQRLNSCSVKRNLATYRQLTVSKISRRAMTLIVPGLQAHRFERRSLRGPTDQVLARVGRAGCIDLLTADVVLSATVLIAAERKPSARVNSLNCMSDVNSVSAGERDGALLCTLHKRLPLYWRIG